MADHLCWLVRIFGTFSQSDLPSVNLQDLDANPFVSFVELLMHVTVGTKTTNK
jgi:hypothetical protein